MKFDNVTKIGSRGRVVIPKKFRNNISVGERLVIFEVGGKIVIEKANGVCKRLREDFLEL